VPILLKVGSEGPSLVRSLSLNNARLAISLEAFTLEDSQGHLRSLLLSYKQSPSSLPVDMETQNQAEKAAQPQQPQQQQQETQPQQSNAGQDSASTMPLLDQSAIPQQLPMNPDGTYMNLDSNTVAGMMPDQILQNPAMAGMGMADPSIMVPLMMPNAGVGLPPNGVSAGTYTQI
jgi:hypothetical protein